MRKYSFILSVTAISLIMSGCFTNTEPATTSLSLMQEVNSSSILQDSGSSRIWYQIDPAVFADSNGDGSGDFVGILNNLSYLSDGDLATTDDLNMTGLLLTQSLLADSSDAVTDYMQLNPSFGTDQDLQNLCTTAAQKNIPVMLQIDLADISKDNTYFQQLCDGINNLQEGEDLSVLDQNIVSMFTVEQDKAGQENWIQIGQSPYYYLAMPSTDIPMINQDSPFWRLVITQMVDHLNSLGVSGYYLQDYNAFYPGEPQKDVDFINWFTSLVKERKPDATVVCGYGSWFEEMNGLNATVEDTGMQGAEGMIAKAVTGSMSAKELGSFISAQSSRGQAGQATALNSSNGSLDLLKSQDRETQLKMALALLLTMSGQVFLSAGDELGLTQSDTQLVSEAIEENDENGEDISLTFGNLKEQISNGNSIYNFVQQAMRLRNSYASLSAGNTTMDESLSTDQVLVLDKSTDSSHTVLVFNLSDQSQSVDISSVQISGLPAELGGVLLTGEDQITLENQTLNLPPYSMALLK